MASANHLKVIFSNAFVNESICSKIFSVKKPLRSPKSSRGFSTQKVQNMRFVQYTCKNNGPQRLGVQLSPEGDIIEVSAVNPSVPNKLVDLLKLGPEFMDKAKRIVAEGKSAVPLSNVCILPPITQPDKIICVGLNYKTHCDEQKKPYPTEPFFFSKFPSTIVGPTDNVKHPHNTRALDWEIELAVVIGRTCRRILRGEVNNYIFGYTVAQDISARDWQKATKNNGQWLFAKSMDTFCPLGPAVVAKEYVADPQNLQLRCSVNQSKKQDSNTNDMVHDVLDIVSYLSHCVTLLPGDVILTGTPSGVGVFSQPRQFLQVGDVIESEISGLGKLKNTIVKE